jgi:hypothetical protein
MLPLFRVLSGLKPILTDPDVWLLWLGLQLPSLRPLYKYLPPRLHPLILIYLLATYAVYADFLHNGRLKRGLQGILSSGWTMVCLVAVTLGLNRLVYPLAYALKYQKRGSDQDYALLLVGNRLWHLVSPYALRTYYGNPISAGPGLVLLLLPFLSMDRYFLITPLMLAAVAYTLYRISGSFYQANLFLGLCLSSLAFWETMVAGSDLFVVGGFMVLCLAFFYSKLEKNTLYLVCGILFLALIATTRVVFLYLPPLYSLFLWKRRPWLGYTVFIFALFGALLLHGIFYFWDPPNYTPLHLVGKGGLLLPGYLKISLIICALAIGWLTLKNVTDNLVSWLFYLWLALFTPLAFITFADLMYRRHFDFAAWEGANYLLVPLAALVSYIVLKKSVEPSGRPAAEGDS